MAFHYLHNSSVLVNIYYLSAFSFLTNRRKKSTPASEWQLRPGSGPSVLWNPRKREGDILTGTDGLTAERVTEERGRRETSEPEATAEQQAEITTGKKSTEEDKQQNIGSTLVWRKLRRKLLPKLLQVSTLSWSSRWSVEVLHLLLDAGSRWTSELHIQSKRKKEGKKQGRAENRQAATLPIRQERNWRQQWH